ncbi:vgr related protein [Pacificimonas sp. WHA3]|uniref:Vgr related protein n=2 Tax=Pacificimonas pallii TaxID=2827236 RepID=A0ABS6SAJ6_9SPHN|nr:vgr related protein [Pacificimonas pallii]
MAASVFGAAIDMNAMRFCHGKWWFLQPAWITMAPDGNIWLHPNSGLWRDDYSTAPLWLRGHIMHELTHVWQHQQGIFLPLKRHPFCRYGYDYQPGREFGRYGLEQQAEIVRHAYMHLQGHETAGKPDAPTYAGLLPFGAMRA